MYQFTILAESETVEHFHHIPGNLVKKVTLSQPERQAAIAAVAIVMKEDQKLITAVGIILMHWMYAIMLWKGSH